MILYKSDRDMLSALRTAQGDEAHWVVPDKEHFCCYQSSGWESSHVEHAYKHSSPVRISVDAPSFDPSIEYLISTGLLSRKGSSPALHVTHLGWINRSITKAKIAELLLTHAAFPSIVAFLTVLLTKALGL